MLLALGEALAGIFSGLFGRNTARNFSGAFAWDHGQGPWGNSSRNGASRNGGSRNSGRTDEKVASQPDNKPTGASGASSTPGGTAGRRANGPQQRSDIDDMVNAFAGRFKAKPGQGRGGFGGGMGGNLGGQGGGFGGIDLSQYHVLQYVLAAVVTLWLLTGFYIVAADEQGVVTRFGRYVQTTDSGLNFHLPWPLESVVKLPVTRENITEIGFRSNRNEGSMFSRSTVVGAMDVPEESQMLTGDENIIDLDFTVRWKISNPASFMYNVAAPEDTVADVAESVMREVIALHPIDAALTDSKLEIQQQARKHLQALLDYYRIGVQISGVELQQVNPPSEVIDAFRDVQAARADAEKAINEAQGYANQILPLARGQAAQVLQAAEGYRTATVSAAQGDAARFNAQVNAYKANPGVIKERLYLEAMQDVMKDANKVILTNKNGQALPFLPLDRMVPAAASKSNAAPVVSEGGQN